ncbi:MAG: ComF family protein [Deltaproteobacteria bacterium]|nr:ComF family protein [Deltaproteobacteria bacterium]MBZ0220139.1 ComF family protein [Deltaproteobacteria bacterium]
MLNALLDILLPRLCLLCGVDAEDDGFCPGCADLLSESRICQPMCSTCGEPFPDSAGPDRECGACIGKAPPFISARSAYLYEEVVQDAVHRFKYAGEVSLAKPLGRLLSRLPMPLVPHKVVPVPLHPKRLKERGFNQSLLLARVLCNELGLSLARAGLERTRDTEKQTGLGADERKKNVAGAFSVRKPGSFKGMRVLLVDDVYTTGATIRECARALRKDGAEVMALTLARARRL